MAAGKSFEIQTFDGFLKPLSLIFPVRPEGDFSSETSSDLCSDSGNEMEENAKNVARWLESLPNEENWCKAEEESILHENGTTGDAEFNSTTREIPSKKRTTVNKYRRGTPRVATDLRCKKKKTLSLSVVEKIKCPTEKYCKIEHPKEEAEEAPNFLNEELAATLDESMTRAIRRYKRHETSWPLSFARTISSSEPPTKRSKS